MEFEQHADLAIEWITEEIDIETQFVKTEHEFLAKLSCAEHIIAHLDERIPAEMKHLHKLNDDIAHRIKKIIDLIEKFENKELRIEKEETDILNKLKQDFNHKDWKAVKNDIKKEEDDERQVLRLETKELKKIHSQFEKLTKLIKTSNLVESVNKDESSLKNKNEFERLEEYYFLQIYKFCQFYESLFRNLLNKEQLIVKKIERN